MILIPIRTEMVARRTPLANYALVAANILLFIAFNVLGGKKALEFRDAHLVLQSEWPAIYQFLTYQFLHGDGWHLFGNMLFLWVFGNSVNAKLGDLGYALFYLAGGVFAALVFAVLSEGGLLGASGSIAAVTTAYLVLFPRSHVTVVFIFFFITFFEVPAILLIVIKVILWDNVLAPSIYGAGNVAVEAHLGGYFFGFTVGMGMLLLRIIARDQFDMLALLDRWNRRRAYRATLAHPEARQRAEFGTVAQARPQRQQDQRELEKRLDRITDLRSRIAELLDGGKVAEAAGVYEELRQIDPSQCLPANYQLLIARHFYETGRHPQAADAFERYLANYREGVETDEIRLLLGIIYARDLKQYQAAEKHLSRCSEKLKSGSRREQCMEWLDLARRATGRPATDA